MTRKFEMNQKDKTDSWFRPWMKFCLYFLAAAQLATGALLIVFFDLAYWALGVAVTTPALPAQLLGVFYLVRGFACALAAWKIERHLSQLWPVLFAMLGCGILLLAYGALGRVRFEAIPVALVVDFLFIPVLWRILSSANRRKKDKAQKDRTN